MGSKVTHAFTVLTVVFVFGAGTSSAFAQGVGPGGPFETSYVLERVSFLEDPIAWGARIGTPSNRIPVGLDPAGLPWVKHLDFPTGSSILPGETIAIVETLAIAGSSPWTGWQEWIVTPDFDWVHNGNVAYASVLVYGSPSPPPGAAARYVPPSAGAGAGVEFSFDQLAAGTKVMIDTRLVYTGSAPFYGTITVGQFPTPEPAAGLLLGLGALGIARRHRRCLCRTLAGGVRQDAR